MDATLGSQIASAKRKRVPAPVPAVEHFETCLSDELHTFFSSNGVKVFDSTEVFAATARACGESLDFPRDSFLRTANFDASVAFGPADTESYKAVLTSTEGAAAQATAVCTLVLAALRRTGAWAKFVDSADQGEMLYGRLQTAMAHVSRLNKRYRSEVGQDFEILDFFDGDP
jgi:hypothetical protein